MRTLYVTCATAVERVGLRRSKREAEGNNNAILKVF
jgi:hypothetical protein